MNRPTTLKKEEKVIKEFKRLLRSGKDLSTNSMYEDAGKIIPVEWRTAGNMIRKHYREQITEDMRIFVDSQGSLRFEELHKSFCQQFKLCKREGRLLLGYIR